MAVDERFRVVGNHPGPSWSARHSDPFLIGHSHPAIIAAVLITEWLWLGCPQCALMGGLGGEETLSSSISGVATAAPFN